MVVLGCQNIETSVYCQDAIPSAASEFPLCLFSAFAGALFQARLSSRNDHRSSDWEDTLPWVPKTSKAEMWMRNELHLWCTAVWEWILQKTSTAMKLAGQLPRITGLTTSFLLGPFVNLFQIGACNPSSDSNLTQRIDTDNTHSRHSLLEYQNSCLHSIVYLCRFELHVRSHFGISFKYTSISFPVLVVLLVLLVLLPPVLPAGFSFLDCVRKLERSCSIWTSWVTWDGSLRWSGIDMLWLGECTSSLQSSLYPNAVYGFVWMINFWLQITPSPDQAIPSIYAILQQRRIALVRLILRQDSDHPIRMVRFSRNSPAPINFDPKAPLYSVVSPHLQLSC